MEVVQEALVLVVLAAAVEVQVVQAVAVAMAVVLAAAAAVVAAAIFSPLTCTVVAVQMAEGEAKEEVLRLYAEVRVEMATILL